MLLLPKVSGIRPSRFAYGTRSSPAQGFPSRLLQQPSATGGIFPSASEGTAPLAMRQQRALPTGFAKQDTGSAGETALWKGTNLPSVGREEGDRWRRHRAGRQLVESSLPGRDSQPVQELRFAGSGIGLLTTTQGRPGTAHPDAQCRLQACQRKLPDLLLPRRTRNDPGQVLSTALGVVRAATWTLDPSR